MAKETTESKIGTTAAKMLEVSLLNEIKALGLQLSDDPADRKSKSNVALTPARKSTTYKRMVKGDRKKLRGIAIHMGKHMFVQEYGSNSYRESHYYTVKNEMHKRRGSRIRISKKRFISRVVKKSGAVEYLAKAIGEKRKEEVVTYIIKTFENGN